MYSMSYSSAKRGELFQRVRRFHYKGIFSGGYVDNTPSVDLFGFYSPYLRNARLFGQSIIIRPGHELFATLNAGSYPKGIGSYLRTDPTKNRIIVRHNQDSTHKLVSIDTDGAVTDIKTNSDITSDKRMAFTNVADNLYCMNGVDKFGLLNGTTYTPITSNVPSSFAPAYSVVFNGSQWASGRPTNPNVVYKSTGTDLADFTSTGSDEFKFIESITGLAANNQSLFYFTPNTIAVTTTGDINTDSTGTTTYFNRYLQVKEGSVNHASLVEAGDEVYYVSPSLSINKIAKSQNINGFEVIEMSQRDMAGINVIMSTLDPDQSDCFGFFLPKENLIKWYFKSNGSTFHDVVIVYDTIKDAFLPDGQCFMFGGIYRQGRNFTISMIEPKVYIDEYGQSDENSPIPFEYRTKEFYISDGTWKKILWEARTLLDINELAVVTQEIWADGGMIDTCEISLANILGGTLVEEGGGIGTDMIGYSDIGDDGPTLSSDDYIETYILRTKGNLNAKGRKFQFRWYNNSLAGKLRLKDVNAKTEVLDPLATALIP